MLPLIIHHKGESNNVYAASEYRLRFQKFILNQSCLPQMHNCLKQTPRDHVTPFKCASSIRSTFSKLSEASTPPNASVLESFTLSAFDMFMKRLSFLPSNVLLYCLQFAVYYRLFHSRMINIDHTSSYTSSKNPFISSTNHLDMENAFSAYRFFPILAEQHRLKFFSRLSVASSDITFVAKFLYYLLCHRFLHPR